MHPSRSRGIPSHIEFHVKQKYHQRSLMRADSFKSAGTFMGRSSKRVCAGPVRRRDFLRLGLTGFSTLGLPDLFRLRAETPVTRARPSALIVVWLHGGASHIETYDPKPKAPSEY